MKILKDGRRNRLDAKSDSKKKNNGKEKRDKHHLFLEISGRHDDLRGDCQAVSLYPKKDAARGEKVLGF